MTRLPRYTPSETFTLLTGLRAEDYLSTEAVAGHPVRVLDVPRLLADLDARPFESLREYLLRTCGREVARWMLEELK